MQAGGGVSLSISFCFLALCSSCNCCVFAVWFSDVFDVYSAFIMMNTRMVHSCGRFMQFLIDWSVICVVVAFLFGGFIHGGHCLLLTVKVPPNSRMWGVVKLMMIFHRTRLDAQCTLGSSQR